MKPVRKRALVSILLLVVGGGGAFVVWQQLRPNARRANPGPETAKVVRRDFSTSVLATGAVKPQVGAEVRVGARISGRVERLHANVGDVVKKGQLIAELEKADLEATVSQRQAELELTEAKLTEVQSLRPKEIEVCEANVAQWEATVALAQKDRGREDELLKKGFTSQEAKDQAQERHAVAQAQLTSARKALELARARQEEHLKQAKTEIARAQSALENARVQVSFATLRAPIGGVIGSVSTQEGETVAAGLNAPTFVTIVDLNRLQVDAYVDEVDIGKIKVGQKAVFTVDAYPAEEFQGKVTAIYPKAVIRENVVYYDVVIDIEKSGKGLLRPEMTASVTILLEARQAVLAVAVKAVKRERGKTVVYTASEQGPQPREVKIGWRDGQWVEIAAGLEEGQTVFLDTPNMSGK